jgi:anaerobic selenocysteine-containing dehydrogenase
MKISRRNFIALLAGGAAGIHITPVPWKITDDIAIWTQNWPWLPVPPVGAFSHEKSVCTLCPGGCGIEVRKVDERAVKIEGRRDYPVNPGGICPLGSGGLQLLHNENLRFPGPMKRYGPRGSGSYQGITWDEALSELAVRIKNLRQTGRVEALAAVEGYPLRSTMSLMVARFMDAVGSANYFRVPTMVDTYAFVNAMMQGSEAPMAYDLENADFVLSFGCGLIEGWGSPGRMLHAWGLWRETPPRGTIKIVQIESRASNTASKADQWLAPVPGTETALALGLAHVIVKENLYHKAFVEEFTHGFQDWVSEDGRSSHKGFRTLVLEQFTPDYVSAVTGLKADDVTTLAREFVAAKAPIALCGRGKGLLNGSCGEFMAVQCLNALVGNINRAGGVLVHAPLPLSPWPEVKMDSVAMEGRKKNQIDLPENGSYPLGQRPIGQMAEAIHDSERSPVDTLLVFSGNPAYTLPDGGDFQEALKKVPFVVSFSPYRDETALMADLILPDHTHLEKIEDIVWPSGLQYPLYGLSRPVVDPLYDTRHCGDVLIRLAKALGGDVAASFPWNHFEQALKDRTKGLFDAGTGLTRYDESSPPWEGLAGRTAPPKDSRTFDEMWKKIKSRGFWYLPSNGFALSEGLFRTPSGRFEFQAEKIETAVGGLGRQSPLKPEYPLLMLPYEMINLSAGRVPNPPYLNKTLFDHQLRKDDSFAEINPQTAAEYDLEEGSWVVIQSRTGQVQVRMHLFEGAMPGVVYLPLGFGHTSCDDYLGGKGANPNKIIDAGKDPLSGQYIWWNTRVRLVKV